MTHTAMLKAALHWQKDVTRDILGGRHYPLSYLTGELKEIGEAVKAAAETPQVSTLLPKLSDPAKVNTLLDNATKTKLQGVPFLISVALPAFLGLVRSNPKPYLDQVQKANPAKLQQWIDKQPPELFKGVRHVPATGTLVA